LGIFDYYAGLPDQSILELRKCLELSKQFPTVHMNMELDFLEMGKFDSAMAEVEKEPDSIWQTYGLAFVFHALAKEKEAYNKMTEFINRYQNGAAFQVAEIYAYRNEKDKAFEWLERAYKLKDGGLTEIVGDPLLRNIVKDPRYAAFMKKMKLPL
jgi:tetratricopeptide (TPR) repeat protein